MNIKKAKLGNNTRIVLRILKDEIQGNVQSAIAKLSSKYTMTWVYQDRHGKFFPRVGPGLRAKDLSDVYRVKGRQYDIKHIAEGDGVVMVELVESYPASDGRVYRTPLVLVLEMKVGKIRKGRHYCDPRLSRKFLSRAQIAKAFQ